MNQECAASTTQRRFFGGRPRLRFFRDPWGIATSADVLPNRFAVISLIRIQEAPSTRKDNDDGIERCGEPADVMSMGPGDDQRQRDATTVYQKVPLASFFSPDLSDSDQLLPAQGAL